MREDNEDVLASHVIFSTYGFWLPNDPRGSSSTEVRAANLQPFGPARLNTTGQSVARRTHDVALRREAKQAITYPEVTLTGEQALSVGLGFKAIVRKCGYRVHACAILPQHAHLVIARHTYSVKQVGRLLKQGATARLLEDGRHPFAHLRKTNGDVPSVWAQDFHKVFLYTVEEVLDRILYVEENPEREGKPRQTWSFVTPYDPLVRDASQKRS
jgi:REP element-mobilizing transposase RayT